MNQIFYIFLAGQVLLFSTVQTVEKKEENCQILSIDLLKQAKQELKNRNYKEAFKQFEKLAKNGIKEAQYSLGLMYLRGTGLKKNTEKGLYWLKKAAQQNDLTAICELGRIYKYGIDGVNKNEKESFEWYKKAVNQGSESAQYDLGLMYIDGEGVDKDLDKGEKLLMDYFTREKSFAASQCLMELAKRYERNNPEKSLEIYKKIDSKESNKRISIINNRHEGLMFDCKLAEGKRKILREAIKKAGGEVISERDETFGDLYHSNKILPGSSQLTVLYTFDGDFALAEYIIPKLHKEDIINIIESKYGDWDLKIYPSISLYQEGVEWHLNDGIQILVGSSNPNSSEIFLRIRNPEKYRLMEEQIKDSKKSFWIQSGAF